MPIGTALVGFFGLGITAPGQQDLSGLAGERRSAGSNRQGAYLVVESLPRLFQIAGDLLACERMRRGESRGWRGRERRWQGTDVVVEPNRKRDAHGVLRSMAKTATA